MEKSLEQLKHIERISRQTRQHRTHLHQLYDQKLDKELNNLANEYKQTFLRSKTHQKLEEQRKQMLGITIQQIAHERQRSSISTTTPPTDHEIRPLSSIKLPSIGKSCRLFSHNCQLYPCQPIYHYTSFTNKEHDQTLGQRKLSNKNSDVSVNSSHLQNIFTNIQDKNYRQLPIAVQNQHHLANRYVSMKRTMAHLNEQSRLLHERLADKRTFGYTKDHQHQLKEAIQRHLKISAKFCA